MSNRTAIADAERNRDARDSRWESVVEELSSLARESATWPEFAPAALKRVVAVTEADAAAVWRVEADRVENTGESVVGESDWLGDRNADSDYRSIIESVARSRRTRVAEVGDASQYSAVLCPVPGDDAIEFVWEVLLPAGLFEGVLAGLRDFVEAVSELTAEFLLRSELQRLRQTDALQQELLELTAQLQPGADVTRVAAVIANEGRRILGVDRAAVLVGDRARLKAVSGVDRVNRRMPESKRLEAFGRDVQRLGELVAIVDGQVDGVAGESRSVNEFVAASTSRTIVAVPLEVATTERAALIGTLIVEENTAGERHELVERTRAVGRVAAGAIARAQDVESLPLRGLSVALRTALSWLGWRRLPRTLAIVCALAAVVAGLVFVPTDFVIEGRGELQPRVRRDVFAAVDGIVREVRVDHGDVVAAGDVVAVLVNADLEYESVRLDGEVARVRGRLDAIRAALSKRPDTPERLAEHHRLTGEQRQLEERLVGFAEQRRLLDRRLADLFVRAPVDGEVLTWQARRNLMGQSMDRGERVVSVGDVAGEWILELHVTDDRIGHVLAARRTAAPLAVDFVLATEPDVTYRGTVERIAETTEFDDGESTVRVTVALDGPVQEPRPGATVIPRIHCGRRSIGYVWFHEAWDALRTRFVF